MSKYVFLLYFIYDEIYHLHNYLGYHFMNKVTTHLLHKSFAQEFLLIKFMSSSHMIRPNFMFLKGQASFAILGDHEMFVLCIMK